VLKRTTVTDDLISRAMEEFVQWTDPRDGMEQALLAVLRPIRMLCHEEVPNSERETRDV
jgi:hypothetical protein